MKLSTIALLLFSLLGAAAIAARPTPVSAGGPTPTWVSWEFSAAFVGGKVDPVYTIHLGYDDQNGDPVLLHSEPIGVFCAVEGNVQIGSGFADFNGGYIACELPDLAQTTNDVIRRLYGPEHELAISSSCDCSRVKGTYASMTGLSNADGPNPIFRHPSIGFSLPTDHDMAALSLSVDPLSSQSSYQPVGGRMTRFRSDLLCDSVLCKFMHAINGSIFDVQSQTLTTLRMDTGAAKVLIGFDADSGDLFSGRIERIDVDPGCYIIGTG